MKRLVGLTGLLFAAHGASIALADSHKILVMRAEGNADAGTRAKIDVQILKIAKSVEGNVEAGDISFSDAAMATGCTITEPACKDEVLATLGVDEIVVTTVTNGGGGELKVNVKRLAKGAAGKDANTTVPAGQAPDQKLNQDVGPMFGLIQRPTATPTPAPVATPKPTPAPTPTPAVSASPGTSVGAELGAQAGGGSAGSGSGSAAVAEPGSGSAAPKQVAQADHVTAAPDGQVTAAPSDDDHGSNHRYEVTGMAVGGGLAALGVIFWATASSKQGDIDAANPKSPKDFQNLQDLESSADSYATLGNICFIGGVAVAAASTYFYWRDRKSGHARTATIAPTVFNHGAGLTLSFGGGR